MTDKEGKFNFKNWPGQYDLEIVPKNNQQYSVCTLTQSTAIRFMESIGDMNFGVGEKALACNEVPLVTMTQPLLVPCESSTIFVQIANRYTTVSASNTLEVKLDPMYKFVSATSNVTQNGNVLLFEVPALMPKEKMTVSIQVSTPCAVPYGKVLPVHARLVQQPCADQWTDALWSVQGKCENGKVVFEVQDDRGIGNTSGLNFEVLRNYFTIERQPRIDLQQNSFQWSIPADGNTYEFRLKGLTAGPWGDSVLTATVTGCTAHADQLVQDQFAYTQPLPYFQKGVFSIYPVVVYHKENNIIPAAAGFSNSRLFTKLQRLDFTLEIQNADFKSSDEVIVDLQFNNTVNLGTIQEIVSNAPASLQYFNNGLLRFIFNTSALIGRKENLFYRFSIESKSSLRVPNYTALAAVGTVKVKNKSPFKLSGFVVKQANEMDVVDKGDPKAVYSGGNGKEVMDKVCPIPGGGMYAVGYSYSHSATRSLAEQIFKLDAKGRQVWNKRIPLPKDMGILFLGLVSLPDSSVIVFGKIARNGSAVFFESEFQLYAVHFDPSGNVISNELIREFDLNPYLSASYVYSTSEGENLIHVYDFDVPQTNAIEHAGKLVKISPDGSLDFKTYADIPAKGLKQFKKTGNYFVWLRYDKSPLMHSGVEYIELYKVGEGLLWAKEKKSLPSNFEDFEVDENGNVYLLIYEIQQSNNTGLQHALVIHKYNPVGDIVFQRKFIEPGISVPWFLDFKYLPGRGFVIAADGFQNPNGPRDVALLSADINFDKSEIAFFGGLLEEEHVGIALQPNNELLLLNNASSNIYAIDHQLGVYHTVLPSLLTTSINNNSQPQPSIIVHPNPAADWLSIVMPEPLVLPQRWELLHTDGVLVQEGVLRDQHQRISLQEVPAGVYLLRMPGTAWAATRVVVQR
jgi:hypothetical protein